MRRILAVLLLLAPVVAPRAATLENYQAIHAPLECEVAAISPDGRRLAFIARTKAAASVRVLDLQSAEVIASVVVTPKPAVSGALDQILWVSATRLIAQVDQGEIVAVDANGKNLTRLVDWEEKVWFDEPITGSDRGFPRSVKIIAAPTAEPDFVYIESASLRRFSVAKVHLNKGRAEQVWDGFSDDVLLYDARAVPRVRTTSVQRPEGFELIGWSGNPARWVPLDRVIQPDQPTQFVITAANVHGPRSVPLGFGRDPEVLYIASNVGRDTFGVYALDLRTGRRTDFALEHPTLDLAQPFLARNAEGALVRDRKSGEVVGVRLAMQQTGALWADADLRAVQQRIEGLVPDLGVRIENWDDARERFLVRLSNRADPGFFAIYDRALNKVRRYITRSSAVTALPRVHSTVWSIKRHDGTLLTGNLTLPAEPRRRPTPVVVAMRPATWGRLPVDYAPEVRALAQMGYAVLEVAHRGLVGLGLRHWEAGRGKLDAVIAEDVFMALDRIAGEAGLERAKVALVGANFGGTAALKLAVTAPERVACVLAEGPLVDQHELVNRPAGTSVRSERLRETQKSFFGSTNERLKEWSPAAFVSKMSVNVPVMFVTLRDTVSFHVDDDPIPGVVRRMKAAGKSPFVLEESAGKSRTDMNARIRVAAEKFLAEHLPVAPR